MAEEKYNRKNPSVKRILQEIKEMQENPSDEYMSLPLEENIFEWQFAVCGPRDSEFEGGIYHGRIQLPAEYPLKPPSFLMLTPNGRFETQTKICLSISNYHPEHWQPSWSVRTALVALIAFMPTNPDGALGSLDFKKEERRLLAIKSREAAPKYGSPERQMLISEIHQYLLKKAPPIPELAPLPSTNPAASNVEVGDNEEVIPAPDGAPVPDAEADELVDDLREVQLNANAGNLRVSLTAGVRLSRTAPVDQQRQTRMIGREPRRSSEDHLYTWAAIALTVAILVLVVKKYMKSTGFAGFQEDS